MLVTRVRLRNIRGIKELDIQIRDPHGRPRLRTLFMGMNGTAKTTILRCIAIGLANIEEANTLIAEPNVGELVSKGQQEAEIYLEVESDSGPPRGITKVITVRRNSEVIRPRSKMDFVTEDVLVVGFGAGRALEGPEQGDRFGIVESSHSLFNYEGTFIQAELTLRRLDDFLGTARFDKAINNILEALGLSPRDQISYQPGGGVVVKGPSVGGQISLQSWADGYRITLNWILDIYARAMKYPGGLSDDGTVSGILLIDEIEHHLHPSLQTGMLSHLRRLFPKMQVFATTHSPLVVLGAAPDELVPLKRKRKWIYLEDVPDYRGYSVEDILALFETSPYSIRISNMLRRYRALVAKPRNSLSDRQINTLESLASELRSQRLLLTDLGVHEELAKIREELASTEA